MADNAGGKQPHGFKPGQSGNPAGKPPGTRHKATMAAEALLDGEADALTRQAIQMALGGDQVALRLCLDRILPPRRSRTVRLALPALTDADSCMAAIAAVAAAVADGQLSPDEATPIAGLVEAARKTIEIVNIETRLAALEAKA
ncbi:DUF5681 domain-containing protein [Acidiphilium sp.]|uniref:DUF5681 domain-containing protein n=1 Tax=Acidiphilium sp. TaxID=527 RepID=UPI003CFFA1B5